ncbi:flagellar hook-length control protein FliK [Armatimonas sp.]|uniref:flagellar hook-length control protein FliK n=1 Tax=Armatimonas sp. TaxID=1872638 RepID=UPI00286A0DDE|nr:flagellar hook-length control protein FliK [Armatimonas sp.]
MIPAPAPLLVTVAPTVKDETAVNVEGATSAPTEATLAPTPQTPSDSLPVLSGLEMASTQELPQEIQAAVDALSEAVAPGTTKHSEGNETLSPTTEMMESPKAAQTVAPVPGTESPSPSVGSALSTTTTAPQEAVATPASTPPTRTAVRLPELSQQLVPILRRVNTEGRQELRVRLDPPHLGELNVIVEDGLDGISVRIVAESRETLLLLQDQRTQLHDELSRQNLSVASFSASLAGDTSGQRSPSRFFAAPTHRSLLSAAVPEAESLSVVARIPLTIGGLDVHA